MRLHGMAGAEAAVIHIESLVKNQRPLSETQQMFLDLYRDAKELREVNLRQTQMLLEQQEQIIKGNARVAELEADAALGRMVREMPGPAMEHLADFAHHIWATWTWYMLSHNDASHQELWRREATAKYAELSDAQKESDRAIVRKWVAALGAAWKGEM
jgi:hypothetical protein